MLERTHYSDALILTDTSLIDTIDFPYVNYFLLSNTNMNQIGYYGVASGYDFENLFQRVNKKLV